MVNEWRMFKEIEDSAVANFMTSIDEFKTKYLNWLLLFIKVNDNFSVNIVMYVPW